jgi:hypothetical protein
MDCWIVMGVRKLQNFAARSYWFAATWRVFHVLRKTPSPVAAWRTARQSGARNKSVN